MNAAETSSNRGTPTPIISTDVSSADSPRQASAPKTSPSMVAFTVMGRPVSVNHLYFTAPHGKRVLTRQGKSFKEAVCWMAKASMKRSGFSIVEKGGVVLNIKFYFETLRGDIDNCIKALMDALTGAAYADDGQVTELHVFKFKDKENPRTEITVWRDRAGQNNE